jgi:hypothetical protein
LARPALPPHTEELMALTDLQRSLVIFIAALPFAFAALPASAAEGFLIETKVFFGKEKEDEKPAVESTTLFSQGIFYDFLKSPAQTAVFRKPVRDKPGRFILLSDKEKVQTEISTEKLARAMAKVRDWAGQHKDPFLKFAANPDFKESFEPDSGKLTLASHLETYTVDTSPAEHPEAIAEYREFLDWYAQLNTLLSGGPPPEPRLRLNQALARHEAVPLKVELTRDGEKEPLRAEHDFTWRISQQDTKRIEDVRAALSSYRPLSNENYIAATKPAEE